MFDRALERLSGDIAIDLGTSSTLVYVQGRGITVEEPSVVAVERSGTSSRVVAVGADAKRMVGRTPEHIQAVRPIREGIIADFELAEVLLRTCVERALGSRPLVKPRMIVCVPVGTTEVERRAIQESARAAGGREVSLVGKSAAAALGAELPIHEATASMVVDIGGGTTEIGLISMGGIVVNASVRAAGDHLDRALVAAIQQQHNTLIGERTAEEIKLRVGAIGGIDDGSQVRVKGRDLGTGIPRDVVISGHEVQAAYTPVLEEVVEGIRRALSRTPPELAADVLDHGLVLCGGGALLRGLPAWLSERTGLPVILAEDPRRCAALGAGALLQDPETLVRVAPA
ncbi:MAG: rod shape-determining protein [Alphaproteobacteria bacterium]|nr:rod shape-determining protein [Alphaproteobacteria bacterium]